MATEKRLIDALPLMQNGWILLKTGISNRVLESKSLADVPTVDAVGVVHGRWIDIYDGIYANPICKCSICGNSAPIEERYPVIGRMYTDWSFTPYCPNCGAKMDGGKEK